MSYDSPIDGHEATREQLRALLDAADAHERGVIALEIAERAHELSSDGDARPDRFLGLVLTVLGVASAQLCGLEVTLETLKQSGVDDVLLRMDEHMRTLEGRLDRLEGVCPGLSGQGGET